MLPDMLTRSTRMNFAKPFSRIPTRRDFLWTTYLHSSVASVEFKLLTEDRTYIRTQSPACASDVNGIS